MTVLNIVGFETGVKAAAWEIIDNGDGTWDFQTTVKRTGSYAVQVNPTTTGIGWFSISAHDTFGKSEINLAACYYRFYFRVDTLPSSGSEEFCAIWGTSGKLRLRITSAGNIQAYAQDGTTQLGSDGTTVLATDGTWYRIEIYCESANPGAYEIKINNSVELSGAGDVSGGNNNRLVLGKHTNRNGQTVNYYFDDVAINSTEYPGAGAVAIMNVDSDGTYTTWTRTHYSNDWENVDEIPPNTDDGIYSTLTIGQASTVGFESAANAGISGAIKAVKYGVINQRLSASSNMKIRLRSGGSDTDSAAMSTPSLNTYVAIIEETDPSTGSTWTLTNLDSIEVGGVENTDVAGSNSYIWSVLLMVDFNSTPPPSPRSFGTIIG